MDAENIRDVFLKDPSEIKNKKLFLFDMDGTIYEEENVFEGTFPLLEKVEQNGGRYVFITNNSSKSEVEYLIKWNRLGIKAAINNLFT